MAKPIPPCPICRSADHVLPIMYGLPAPEGFAAAERKEVVLGGCFLAFDSPRWQCETCDQSFGLMGSSLPRASHKEEVDA